MTTMERLALRHDPVCIGLVTPSPLWCALPGITSIRKPMPCTCEHVGRFLVRISDRDAIMVVTAVRRLLAYLKA